MLSLSLRKLSLDHKSRARYVSSHRKATQENKLPNLGSTFATKNIYQDAIPNRKLVLIASYMFRILIKLCKLTRTVFLVPYLNYMRCHLFLILIGLYPYRKYFSVKSANCIVNPDNSNSDDIITLMKHYETLIQSKLENIIYDKIL